MRMKHSAGDHRGSMSDWNTFRARLEDAKLGGGMSFDERIELVSIIVHYFVHVPFVDLVESFPTRRLKFGCGPPEAYRHPKFWSKECQKRSQLCSAARSITACHAQFTTSSIGHTVCLLSMSEYA